jgi:hypothetical protein
MAKTVGKVKKEFTVGREEQKAKNLDNAKKPCQTQRMFIKEADA